VPPSVSRVCTNPLQGESAIEHNCICVSSLVVRSITNVFTWFVLAIPSLQHRPSALGPPSTSTAWRRIFKRHSMTTPYSGNHWKPRIGNNGLDEQEQQTRPTTYICVESLPLVTCSFALRCGCGTLAPWHCLSASLRVGLSETHVPVSRRSCRDADKPALGRVASTMVATSNSPLLSSPLRHSVRQSVRYDLVVFLQFPGV